MKSLKEIEDAIPQAAEEHLQNIYVGPPEKKKKFDYAVGAEAMLPHIAERDAEIARLREALEWIASGKLTTYINPYGRPQPDFPADKEDMRERARAALRAGEVKDE